MRRTQHGRARGNGKRVNQICHFGIMGGLAPLTGVPLAHRSYIQKHATTNISIPPGCEAGRRWMMGHNPYRKYLLSKNPVGAGRVDVIKKSNRKCNCGPRPRGDGSQVGTHIFAELTPSAFPPHPHSHTHPPWYPPHHHPHHHHHHHPCPACDTWENSGEPPTVLAFDTSTVTSDNFIAYQLSADHTKNAISLRFFRISPDQSSPYITDPFYILILEQKDVGGTSFEVLQSTKVGEDLSGFTETLTVGGKSLNGMQVHYTDMQPGVAAEGRYYVGLWWKYPQSPSHPERHLLEGIVDTKPDHTLRTTDTHPTSAPAVDETVTLVLPGTPPVNNLWFQYCSSNCG